MDSRWSVRPRRGYWGARMVEVVGYRVLSAERSVRLRPGPDLGDDRMRIQPKHCVVRFLQQARIGGRDPETFGDFYRGLTSWIHVGSVLPNRQPAFDQPPDRAVELRRDAPRSG